MNIYSLIENDIAVFTGNAKEISEKYFISKESIYSCEKLGCRLMGKYKVKMVEKIQEQTTMPTDGRAKKRLSKFEVEINEIIKRLNYYGNTILPRIKNEDLNKYLDALKMKGYEVKVKCYNSKTGSAIRLERSKFNKNKYDTDYIVTLK